MKRRVERLEQAARDLRTQAAAGGYGVEPWAELFLAAREASDEPTADLLTQRMSVHEQTAWMLRSLLEN